LPGERSEPVQCIAPQSPDTPQSPQSPQSLQQAAYHPEQDQPHPDDEIEIIPGSEQHITEAHLNAMFGSDEEIQLRGGIRRLELTFLGRYSPLSNSKEAINVINYFRDIVERKIDELCTVEKNQQLWGRTPINLLEKARVKLIR